MARKHRIAAIAVLVIVAGLTAAALGSVYVALGQEQPFYTAALAADQQSLATAGRELESRASALYSETRQPGAWQAVFTEAQINGWLAVKLANNFQEALPAGIREPRISLDEDQVALAFRSRRGGLETVVTARATVMLTDEGSVAVQLQSVHAGALPLPAMQVADDVAQACQELGLPVAWTQIDGRPVAIIDIRRGVGARDNTLSLAALELRQGAIYVEGETVAPAGDNGR